ncbi:MAG: hypothetical protein AAFR56_11420, partial [Chloroflexota bacterium]
MMCAGVTFIGWDMACHAPTVFFSDKRVFSQPHRARTTAFSLFLTGLARLAGDLLTLVADALA